MPILIRNYRSLSELGFPTFISIQNIILICKRFCKKTENPSRELLGFSKDL
nr:MAG TPA: hypothetical protein [Caudoviricetes sp.]DAY63415.1 MAG TPA: hypothetical protein [Caudoviricetes sp.]